MKFRKIQRTGSGEFSFSAGNIFTNEDTLFSLDEKNP